MTIRVRWDRWAGRCAVLVGAFCAAGEGLPVQRDLAYVEQGTPEQTLSWAARSGVDADPSRFVGAHTPPTLIVLAERERFQPPVLEQAALLVRLMYDAERPADLVIVPGTHKSSIADLAADGNQAFAAIRRFIDDPRAAREGSRPSSIR